MRVSVGARRSSWAARRLSTRPSSVVSSFRRSLWRVRSAWTSSRRSSRGPRRQAPALGAPPPPPAGGELLAHGAEVVLEVGEGGGLAVGLIELAAQLIGGVGGLGGDGAGLLRCPLQ